VLVLSGRIRHLLLTCLFINAEEFNEFFLLVAGASPENGGILAVLFSLPRLPIALLLEFQLQQVDLFAQNVDRVCARFQFIRRDFQLVTALVLLKNRALVG